MPDKATDPPLGRIGFEIELLAPPGRSRRDLAAAIAEAKNGRVVRFFHPQAEQSKAVNTPFFENLTLGFAVHDHDGRLIAQCVDDFTLQDDLEKSKPPIPGWYRVVSDDARFLRLAMRHADAEEPLDQVLDPVADLFGVEVHHGIASMVRIADNSGAPIMLGATLPGERERPCELITAPIEENHLEELESLLAPARELEFLIPSEAALHLHFDATSLCSAPALVNLVRFLNAHGEALKDVFQTNPHCRRLGGWPPELSQLIEQPEFVTLEWKEAQAYLQKLKLTKFCDFNLRNLVYEVPGKNTFEVRILPVSLDADEILKMTETFSRIIRWSTGKLKPVPESVENFL